MFVDLFASKIKKMVREFPVAGIKSSKSGFEESGVVGPQQSAFFSPH
jgi:hypothetical protein